MSFFESTEELIASFRVGDARVRGYRLALSEVTQSELGIESNRVGSPYAPLEVASLTGGSFVLEWSDGNVSKGAVSRAPVEALREVLTSAYEGRYEDPDDAVFPREEQPPEIDLYSPEAAEAATGHRPEALPELLGTLRAVADELGVRVLDASARAACSRRLVASSGGFRSDGESTYTSFSVAFDSLVWDAHSSRGCFSLDEVRSLAQWTGEDYQGLRSGSEEAPRGRCRVLLHPRVSEQFLGTYLFSNLSGAAVANGRSCFSIEDFKRAERRFREDFSLKSNPLRPMGTGSFRCTDEGVVAREVEFVREGRLVTPVLGLKYAQRLGLPPAPLAAGFDGYAVGLETSRSRESVMEAGGEVVVVHSVLGLHTQDTVRGEYSVLAPQGILYRDGRAMGRVSATLNGSFFDNLRSEDLETVQFDGFRCPGLLLTTELS